MHQLRWTLIGAGVLTVFVISLLALGRPMLFGHAGVPPVLTPLPAVANFPDITHIPMYPGATVTFTRTGGFRDNTIWYQVPDRLDKVRTFYHEMLPQQGWQSRDSHELYSWTDPSGTSFWGVELQVAFTVNSDFSETTVTLNYSRYPNPAAGLRVYPGAQHVQVTHSTVEKSFLKSAVSAHITEVTYLTGVHPDTLATFYANTLSEDGWGFHEPGWSTDLRGWSPFDSPGSWGTNSPLEGLYFSAGRVAWRDQSGVVSYNLLATTRPAPEGQTQVTVHVEEFETEVPGF